MDKHLDTMCLPSSSATGIDPKDCFVMGWGKEKFGAAGKFQETLKQVSLPIVNNEKCQSTLRQTRLGTNWNLHNSLICAGGKSREDACEGDGGGALVCNNKLKGR